MILNLKQFCNLKVKLKGIISKPIVTLPISYWIISLASPQTRVPADNTIITPEIYSQINLNTLRGTFVK